MTPARSELPDDAAAWNELDVFFERLPEDSAASCPIAEEDAFQYVRTESADAAEADRARMHFLRTAQVEETRYWMWCYREVDGRLSYVVVRLDPDGTVTLGLAEPNGLSTEQYLLADYHDEIYWP